MDKTKDEKFIVTVSLIISVSAFVLLFGIFGLKNLIESGISSPKFTVRDLNTGKVFELRIKGLAKLGVFDDAKENKNLYPIIDEGMKNWLWGKDFADYNEFPYLEYCDETNNINLLIEIPEKTTSLDLLPYIIDESVETFTPDTAYSSPNEVPYMGPLEHEGRFYGDGKKYTIEFHGGDASGYRLRKIYEDGSKRYWYFRYN